MRTKKTVIAAMFASLACVATMIIKIPSPLNGFINLGDGVVLLAGWLLSPFYGMLAAGIGTSLADIFLGYVSYAPATLVIKSLMAVVAFFVFRMLNRKIGNLPARIVSGIAAEMVMIVGYFVFEGLFLYGFAASMVNIPSSIIQGVAGLIISTVLVRIFEKHKIL